MSVTGADLFRLVCDFVNPLDDDGATSPSLWDQLLAGVGPSGAGRSGAKPGSRLPTDAGVLSLVTEVLQFTHATGQRVPAALRWIEVECREFGGGDAWAVTVHRWLGEARHALGLIPTRIVLPRGTRCPDCDHAWVHVTNPDGEQVREPCVVLMWREPKRDTVERVGCRACGAEWTSLDLHRIAEHQGGG